MFALPKSLVLVVSVDQVLVLTLIVHVFHTQAFQLSMLHAVVTFILDLKSLDADIESLDLVFVLFGLGVTLCLKMLELHVNPLVLTSGILSFLVKSSF